MIDASFIQEITKLSALHIEIIDGKTYAITSQGFREILPDDLDPTIRYAPTLDLTSLTGLADYCQDNQDGATKENHFIQIDDPATVLLLRDTDVNGNRNCAASARACPRKDAAIFHDYDDFVAYILTWFRVDDSSSRLLDVAGRVKDENSSETEDTGVSQTVLIKVGTATASKEKLTNPILLMPNALFPEVEPIPQPHIFRIKSAESIGARFTLKCVAASNWNADIAQSYADYLLTELPGWRILR